MLEKDPDYLGENYSCVKIYTNPNSESSREINRYLAINKKLCKMCYIDEYNNDEIEKAMMIIKFSKEVGVPEYPTILEQKNTGESLIIVYDYTDYIDLEFIRYIQQFSEFICSLFSDAQEETKNSAFRCAAHEAVIATILLTSKTKLIKRYKDIWESSDWNKCEEIEDYKKRLRWFLSINVNNAEKTVISDCNKEQLKKHVVNIEVFLRKYEVQKPSYRYNINEKSYNITRLLVNLKRLKNDILSLKYEILERIISDSKIQMLYNLQNICGQIDIALKDQSYDSKNICSYIDCIVSTLICLTKATYYLRDIKSCENKIISAKSKKIYDRMYSYRKSIINHFIC